jgi:segregation and condensation protein A
MEKLTFHVAEYDAPLDLILYLITKHKLSILEIDLSSLLEQYIAAISQMRERDMELASEFLEMASRLVHMKTISLLPRHEEEAERLKLELVGQLIEYRLCRLAAQRLGELSLDVFAREPLELEIDGTYSLTHPAGLLRAALDDVFGKNMRRRPPPRESFDPIVTRPVISVSSKIFAVLRALRRGGLLKMSELFSADTGRSGVIATFLALLELMKSRKIFVERGHVRILTKE